MTPTHPSHPSHPPRPVRSVRSARPRSSRWTSPDDLRAFGHRSRLKQLGWDADEYNRPIAAVVNTWSELNTCHAHFPERVTDIKRGILQAGGTPAELPAMSLGEQLMKPTAMMFRNLLALETEELLRAYPIDGAVVMGGCDKTTPGVLMGAISMNLPCVYVPAGPMMRGHFRGNTVGSGADVWKHWDELRAGKLSKTAWLELEDGVARTPGTCMTMGTAATMMLAAEALGFSPPGASSLPAVDSDHRRMAKSAGRRVVEMISENLRPSDFLSTDSFHNAITAVLAAGGSTNAVIHLIALSRRAGFPLTLNRFAELSAQTPVIANIKPVGAFVMEDFHIAGGARALLEKIRPLLKTGAKTVNGKTIGENIAGAECFNDEVIRPMDSPLEAGGGLAVLRGTLAPDGCVIKASATKMRRHRGPAIVFENMSDLKARIDSPELNATAESVLVLKNAGPVGGPGMPEWGQLPIPKKLLESGVRDMLRISDARMSGTSYGACVLHVSPESAKGGPLGLAQTGDEIAMDIPAGKLDLLVDDDELRRRRERAKAETDGDGLRSRKLSAYANLYVRHATQAHEGCDFDFASTTPGEPDEPDIF